MFFFCCSLLFNKRYSNSTISVFLKRYGLYSKGGISGFSLAVVEVKFGVCSQELDQLIITNALEVITATWTGPETRTKLLCVGLPLVNSSSLGHCRG